MISFGYQKGELDYFGVQICNHEKKIILNDFKPVENFILCRKISFCIFNVDNSKTVVQF